MNRLRKSTPLRMALLLFAFLGLISGMALSLAQASAEGTRNGEVTATIESPRTTDREVIPSKTPWIGVPTSAPSPTFAPAVTPQPSFTPSQSATPTETPLLGVIWSPEASAVYLREEPHVRVKAPLPNGMAVRLLGERVEKAGLAWVKVAAYFPNAQPAGWVAAPLAGRAFRGVLWVVHWGCAFGLKDNGFDREDCSARRQGDTKWA